MRAQDIFKLLQQTGLQVAYRSWADQNGGTPPARPYLIYYQSAEASLFADDSNFAAIPEWVIELYVDHKDEQLEMAVGDVLSSIEVPYSKNEAGRTSDLDPLLITFRFQTI